MNNKSKTLIGIALFVLFLGLAVFAYNKLSQSYKPQPIELSEGEATNIEKKEPIVAPDFTAYDNDGNMVNLSDYFGKPIVLNFWASWCPPCKSEMPHFNTVYEEMKDDVVFLMVDLVDGQQETEAMGKKYIEENSFSFPVLFDTNQEAGNTYRISFIPTTLFIDKDGEVVTGISGAMNEETLRDMIGKILMEDTKMNEAKYHKISAEEAKKLIDENQNEILLDVRTKEEFDEKHIEGATLIPDYELEDRAETELPDKDALILIYCRSGNRSKKSADLLVSMGYTNVYDFGGINTYPYETISN